MYLPQRLHWTKQKKTSRWPLPPCTLLLPPEFCPHKRGSQFGQVTKKEVPAAGSVLSKGGEAIRELWYKARNTRFPFPSPIEARQMVSERSQNNFILNFVSNNPWGQVLGTRHVWSDRSVSESVGRQPPTPPHPTPGAKWGDNSNGKVVYGPALLFSYFMNAWSSNVKVGYVPALLFSYLLNAMVKLCLYRLQLCRVFLKM